MKQFLKWLGKHIAGAMVFSLFSILFIAGIVYALTYPSAPPAGEVAGGKFQANFNTIFGALEFTGGTVKLRLTATEGGFCNEGNGLVAKDGNGVILSCQWGAWKKGVGDSIGNLPSAIGAVKADGTLWDGSERCINGNPWGFTTKSCIRIANNIIQTKIDFSVSHPNTGIRTATSGWVNGDSEASLSSMPGLDFNIYKCKVFSRWGNNNGAIVPASAPLCIGGWINTISDYNGATIGSPVVW